MTGQEFKDFRKSLNLSQEKLGEILAIDKRTIIKQEQAETVPPLYSLAITHLVMKSRQESFKKATDELMALF